MPTLTAFFDGSCELTRGVWGRASYGAIIFKQGRKIWDCSEIFTPELSVPTSNNLAEYLGFLSILKYLKSNNLDTEFTWIHGDSKLVIEQMRGVWRIKGGVYYHFALEAQALLNAFPNKPVLKWIPREENGFADALSKLNGR